MEISAENLKFCIQFDESSDWKLNTATEKNSIRCRISAYCTSYGKALCSAEDGDQMGNPESGYSD